MISGRQTLASIDDTLREQRDKITAIDRRNEALTQRQVALQKQQVTDYRELARHRVDHIASGQLLSDMDEAERRVQELLRARESEQRELAGQVEDAYNQRLSLEAQRDAQADVLEELAARIDAAEADTQARLEGDPEYQAQRARADETRRMAMHARDKATRREQERHEKGSSYEQDELFMYLWQRQYGTSGYAANPLARLLDGWVAKLIGYQEARADYHRLQEIPERLAEHAQAKEAEAELQFQQLQQLDAAALGADGVLALEQQQASEQEKLAAIDQRIAAAEESYRDLLARKERFAAGEDQAYHSIVGYLSNEFAADNLRELREEALATPYPEDDLIVARLMECEREKGEIERAAAELKKAMAEHRRRLSELETMRAEFKRRRYDNPRSGFSDGALVGVVLGNLLDGALKSDALWDVLERQQRYNRGRSRPDFGSGGFGRGTPWGGGAGPFGGGHRGGFGGDIFRTGGGFGGGGNDFRTRGGF